MKNIVIFTVALFLVTPALAKDGPRFSPLSANEQFVAQAAQFARSKMTGALMPDGKHMKRESKKEMKIPLIPFEKEQEVVDRGVFSITAEHCGFDWESKFEPYMKSQAASGQWDSKQLTYMRVLHGFTMGIVDQKLRGSECTAGQKSAVKNHMGKL